MEMNTGKQLLVDDRIVEDIWNVRRQVIRPAKCIDNPLMVADRPWEDQGVAGCYVLFDAEENLFKMWYNVFNYVAWKNEEDHCYTYWICYAESKDGLSWDKPDLGIVEYEGYYFGLLQIYYSATKATIDIQLAFSRDGKHWDRLPTRDVFLGLGTPHGQGADFDSGMVIVSRPVLVGDELWFYYTGYKAVHTEFSNTYAVGLAVAKLDRLIGRATPPGEWGLLLTRPLVWEGDTLETNVSSANGTVQVEVLSEDGEVLEGYERASSVAFSGDSLRHPMQWKDGRTMGALRSQRLRLKFYLSNAVLYAFGAKNGVKS
jgi:hypothetical protein